MVIKKGTSIIELTVVIGLVSLLALSMSAIMLTTITSSNRLHRSTKLKQAGDYALTQIQTSIRNSRSIISCDEASSSLSLTNPDGDTTAIFLESNRIASNSGIYLTPSTLLITNFVLTCQGDPSAPSLFKIAFDISEQNPSVKASENTTLHFETTTSTRND